MNAGIDSGRAEYIRDYDDFPRLASVAAKGLVRPPG